MAKQQERTLGILSHVLGLFTSFIGPLIIYLASEDKFSKDQAKEALNWQFSLIIYSIISAILMIILIGFLLIIALGIMNLVFSIIAAIKASEGKTYQYPLTIRFFK